MSDIVLKLTDLAPNGCQSPYSSVACRSRAGYEEFGSSREPAHVCSPEAEARRHGYVVNLAGIERPDMDAAEIGMCNLFAGVLDRAHINRIIDRIGGYLPLDDIGCITGRAL